MRKHGANLSNFKKFTDLLCKKYGFISHSEYEMNFDSYHYHFSNKYFVIYIRYSNRIEDCKIMCSNHDFMDYKDFETIYSCVNNFVKSIFEQFI